MRTVSFTLTLLFLAAFPGLADDRTDQDAIRKTLSNYVLSGDLRDAELAGKALHPRAVQFFHTGEGVRAVDRDQYQALLTKGEIGGQNRQFEVPNLELYRNTALARLVITSDTMIFSNYVTLMKEGGAWKIVSVTIPLSPNTAAKH